MFKDQSILSSHFAWAAITNVFVFKRLCNVCCMHYSWPRLSRKSILIFRPTLSYYSCNVVVISRGHCKCVVHWGTLKFHTYYLYTSLQRLRYDWVLVPWWVPISHVADSIPHKKEIGQFYTSYGWLHIIFK